MNAIWSVQSEKKSLRRIFFIKLFETTECFNKLKQIRWKNASTVPNYFFAEVPEKKLIISTNNLKMLWHFDFPLLNFLDCRFAIFLLSVVKLSHLPRYHDDACVGFVCICGLIHGTIHARSLGTKKIARRKSLVYG